MPCEKCTREFEEMLYDADANMIEWIITNKNFTSDAQRSAGYQTQYCYFTVMLAKLKKEVLKEKSDNELRAKLRAKIRGEKK